MRPLHVYARKLRFGPVAEILRAAGWRPTLGRPAPDGTIGVWGASPIAWRGERMAERTGASLLRIEDPWLRSVRTGRSGEPPLGLLIDRGLHFDASKPSDLETLLASHPFDDAALLGRARDAMERLKRLHLSKYNAFDPALPPPDPGYVLVVDQTRGDASVTASGATEATFRDMLIQARLDHPGARVLIRGHPETAEGHRAGHFAASDAEGTAAFADPAISPWHMLEGAVAVYTVSSQLGFEAIMAGHRPVVFGTPFYAGWGLTEDRADLPRRKRRLTRAQLVAGALVEHPVWYDPHRRERCDLETVIDILEARVRAWREDARGYVALNQRLWKRRHLQAFFGTRAPVRFTKDEAEARRLTEPPGAPHLLRWGAAPDGISVEDGFLRSRGLGADLVPPLSLVRDRRGMYFDATRESDLDILLRAPLTEGQRARADRLRRAVVDAGITKYNVGEAPPPLPEGRRILVPGQVEDDASIRLGAPGVRTNAGLLRATREANPDAVLIYKPHPDVEAGLRPGAIDAHEADIVARDASMNALLQGVQEVWTITSLAGFEALVRGLAVTALGMPFYAGRGLTTDHLPRPEWREDVDLTTLIHGALIAYPRYHDPVIGRPCPPEVALMRLAEGGIPGRPALRALAKAQGLLSGYAGLWRQR